MKYLHLIWAALFRRKTRTILTLVSIIAAFLLFGLLDAVRVSFAQAGQGADGAERLQTGARLSFIQPLPQSLQAQIAALPGVKMVTYANWFGGAYQDPRNQVFSFAVPETYLDAYPEIAVSAAERKAFADTRTGALIGEGLAEKFKWKVGDKIPLQSNIFPDKSGSKNWSFDIVGIMHSTDKQANSFADQQFLLNWKYFDETTPYNRGNVGWYVTRVTDVNQADRVAKAIDAISENSDHETNTQTEQAAMAGWLKQFADIGLIVTGIMGAVFFTLLLLSGNTMMQAVRERTSEMGVLKTIGFSNGSVMAMVLAESVLLLVIGGLVGLALASGIVPLIAKQTGGMMPMHSVGASTWVLGVVLMALFGLLVGALPGWNALRLNTVDALAGR